MVQQRKVAIVVDSSSCLPKDVSEKYDIVVVPHELVIDGVSYRDGIDISPTEFYQLLQKNGRVPTTSAPRPSRLLEAFKQASEKAEDVLCLTLSRNFSATYEWACSAQDMARRELPGLNIRVLDTQAAAGAQGLIALAAARAAEMGLDLDTVAAEAESLIPKVNLIAFLDTLYFLGRSGRIPKIAAWAGSLLGVKPLTEMRLGEARLLEKPRSRNKATQRLLSAMESHVSSNPVHVMVMHANAAQDAEALSREVEMRFNCAELLLGEFTPVMGAHTGPGLLGLAFYPDH